MLVNTNTRFRHGFNNACEIGVQRGRGNATPHAFRASLYTSYSRRSVFGKIASGSDSVRSKCCGTKDNRSAQKIPYLSSN